jgi:hypothetical protein
MYAVCRLQMKDLLLEFHRVTRGRKPEHLIFFRDGVSEGQFKEVYYSEYSAVREACRDMGDPGAECEHAPHNARRGPEDCNVPVRLCDCALSCCTVHLHRSHCARAPCLCPLPSWLPSLQTRRPSLLWWCRRGTTPASSPCPRTNRTATAAATFCQVGSSSSALPGVGFEDSWHRDLTAAAVLFVDK